ncbi:MAG TPA: phage holin family protein [Dehalococcoidia bacterium]
MSRRFYFEWRRPERGDFGFPGLVVRFLVNVAALWLAQFIIPGFDIDSIGGLIFGAVIFGVVNAFIKPVVSLLSCPLTLLTLGLFTLIINTMMLGLTAWIAGLFDLSFDVDGFFPAFFGAIVIAIVSTILGGWAERNVLATWRRPNDDW